MAVTPVPPLSDIPTFPALADRASGNYNGMAYAFGVHMSDKFVQELVPVVASAVSNATEAQAQAQLAIDARTQTQADRAATGQDRTATAADRVQTNLDKLAAQAAAAQAGNAGAFTDSNPIVKGASDNTKQWRMDLSGLPTGVQRVTTPPSENAQLVTRQGLASMFFNRAKSIDTSGNFVAEVTGTHRITLIGAPGSGGLAALNDSNGSFDSAAAATGGATGGIAIKTVTLQAGDSLAVVIGAPGSVRQYGPANATTAYNGLSGGQSRVTGAGVALIANGGGGGFATTTTNNTTAIAAGAVGGTASGGDINITGADSGTATASPGLISTTKYPGTAATGGAGVPYYGQRFASGNATTTGSAAATGGSSPSGSSGNVTTTTPGLNAASGGAGTSGTANVSNGGGTRGPGLPTFAVAGFSLTGNGGIGSVDPSNNADGAGNGGAGGGYAFRPASAGSTGSGGSSGIFAGSGAASICRNPVAGNIVSAGVPGRGGASGGVAAVTNSTINLLVPAGGSAVCVIEYYQEQA